MRGSIVTVVQALQGRRRAWRRARNLRSGAPAMPRLWHVCAAWPAGVAWIAAAGAACALGGALLIVGHAQRLVASTGAAIGATHGAGPNHALDAFHAVLPGATFDVPASSAVAMARFRGGALLVLAGMRAGAPVRVDLCSQVLDRVRGRIAPLRVGYRFADVARWVARNEAAPGAVTLRNVLLGEPGMPRIEIGGAAAGELQLAWEGADDSVRWIGDASAGQVRRGIGGKTALRRDGWLAWGQGKALHVERRASAACADAGELVFTLYAEAAGHTARALVRAYPAQGAPVSAYLHPGRYAVPSAPPPSLEDQALFQQLERAGLVRLGAHGLAELVPRDLAAWRLSADTAHAADLASWRHVVLDQANLKLVERLYRMADGDYVREQVRVFNGERRLLAWRLRPDAPPGEWRASVAALPATTSAAMPAAAARLFADFPQGWAPWTRIARWPWHDGDSAARLALPLARPASGGERLQLLLAGRLAGVHGARLHATADACTGRACPAPGAVQLLTLELLPGARALALDAQPLEMAAIAGSGEQRYRHLRVAGGRLEWLPLGSGAARAAAGASDVTLSDRHGSLLWSGGEPTRAAIDAGLAPLLGIRAEHANSVAGMLARLPRPAAARLTLDLALQAASQRALECIGMRRGQWDGRRCSGAQAAPHERRAGVVIVDADSGDILAAAGAGGAAAGAANWSEVRDFDRSNPARSPLRLPALQHDGGAHQSPGSTFKIVSALGLELAAQRDPQLDGLLGGLPLAAINRTAQARGFAFQTHAAAYPVATRLAHITNFRDQHLDRRAQDGRLGLAQALTYSLNTWFAWSGELSDRSLFGRSEGGAPDLQPLAPDALDAVRPIVGMARRLGFERALRLDGGLLPADYAWSGWDALQASAAHIDPIHTRHELRQMAIGLRMQATPLQMALAAGAVGQGRTIAPRLLLALDGRQALQAPAAPLGVRLDRIRAGLKGVVDGGTAAGAFRDPRLAGLRRGLYGKTGTAPTVGELATVWFAGWLEPGSVPGETRRLAIAAFVSHSDATGGEHAAPIAAAILAALLPRNAEQRGK